MLLSQRLHRQSVLGPKSSGSSGIRPARKVVPAKAGGDKNALSGLKRIEEQRLLSRVGRRGTCGTNAGDEGQPLIPSCLEDPGMWL